MQFLRRLFGLCSEVKGISLATRRAPNDDQPPCSQRVQAVTDIALVLSQGLHQFAMPHSDHTIGVLILPEQTSQEMALQP